MRKPLLFTIFSLAALTVTAGAASDPPSSFKCESCATWNVTQAPFRLYGNAYYVGVRGLAAILITSDAGHILIDGDLAESAPKIAAGIRELGFRIEDVKVLLNSHVHYDHAGGIAELQRLSGAQVMASASSAQVLQDGQSGPDDPQFGALPPIAKVANVHVLQDGETVRVGGLAVTAHLTPGHTPGGTSWTWQSCENNRCFNFVYADSLTAVSAPAYQFTQHPQLLAGFEKSFTTLAALPCDILVTPHPQASDLWTRVTKRDASHSSTALVAAEACERYVAAARDGLRARITAERTK
jgi:metallo-beta-lactamase class B